MRDPHAAFPETSRRDDPLSAARAVDHQVSRRGETVPLAVAEAKELLAALNE
jgi:hypothetical protein